MAKIQELRDLGDVELLERLGSDKEELFNLRFQLATGQLDNPMRIKDVRHEIAISSRSSANARWSGRPRRWRRDERATDNRRERTAPPRRSGRPAPLPRGRPGPRGDRTRRKIRVGVVVSDKMDKTVLVRIDRRVRHPLYKKTVARSNKLAAHDETNDAHVGDTVRLMETRRASKTKRWRVVEIVERAK
jgi:small subunit ribosomal protein S17